jgi:DNA-binding transcriptional MocR family regulator
VVGGRAGIDWIDYPTQTNEAPLRAAVLEWLADRDLGPVDAGDVALTNGGQNALLSIFLCCLRGDRPVVLVEEPSYAGFRYAARLARAEVVGLELDDQGVTPDALRAACLRHPAQVLCLTPDAQNPTTGRMSLERRAALVQIARDHDLQVIEDASYGTVGADVPSMRTLAPERVWHTGGLSKSISAALRFGWIVCPRGMGEAGRLTAQHSYFALSRLLMEVVLDLMTSGAAARMRADVAVEMEDRVQMLVGRLGRFGLRWQPGLPITWLPMPSGWRASRFARAAEGEGVLVRAADEYALVHGRAPNAVRVAIAGNMPRDRLDTALMTLVRLLDNPPFEVAV